MGPRFCLVWLERLELPTPASRTQCATKLRHSQLRSPARIRTSIHRARTCCAAVAPPGNATVSPVCHAKPSGVPALVSPRTVTTRMVTVGHGHSLRAGAVSAPGSRRSLASETRPPASANGNLLPVGDDALIVAQRRTTTKGLGDSQYLRRGRSGNRTRLRLLALWLLQASKPFLRPWSG